MIDPRIAATVDRWETIAIEDEIPDRLPLLELMRDVCGVDEFLRGVSILVIQHHLGTVVPLVRSLAEAGAPWGSMWRVDIPYSTNHEVRATLEDLCGEGRCPPLFGDPLADYSSAQLLRVTTTLLDMWRQGPPGRLLVLDDGAYFFRALNALRAISHPAAEHLVNAFVVEQTTRGHRLLNASSRDVLDLGLRVVSVARSRTKEMFEGPFIGASVAQAIVRLASQRQGRVFQKIAVLGFGIVGEACARALRTRFPDAQLAIVEERGLPRSAAAAWLGVDHVQPSLGPQTGYDLVVGCTGRNSFTLADRHLLADGAVLASGSSAAIEFDRAGFVDLADYYPDDDIEIVDREATQLQGIHADITMRLDNARTVTFANAGFPVNFDGRVECLPTEAIQPTRCLMYAAAQQALSESRPGISHLEDGPDEWIYQHALQYLAE